MLHIKGGQKTVLALKVPRQCSLVLLVEVHLKEGKALGNEGGTGIGSGCCLEHNTEFEHDLYCI
jgi:hypothetical protein